MFDKNGDKRISSKEMSAVIMQAIGPYQNLTEEELAKLISKADKDAGGTGTMDFEEFLALMQ
jgi:Ca2+-binding EF-hand superfamily protein